LLQFSNISEKKMVHGQNDTPRRKRTHDHFRVSEATQTDKRGQFGRPKYVAPLEMGNANER
jgi:hypothetical protein